MPPRTFPLLAAALLVATPLLTAPARGDVIEVFPGHTVQDAIDAARDGDVIVVMPGVYRETIDLRGRAITLRSLDPRDPEVTASTIIDGGAAGSVVTMMSGEGPDTVLAGFTITGGYGESGGGLYLDRTSPTVIGCRFVANDAIFDGGGVFCIDGAPLVVACRFLGNTALYGAGMANIASSPSLVNCAFTGNEALSTGGGLDNFADAAPIMVNCTVGANTADDGGGGISNEASSLFAANCIVWGNSLDGAGHEIRSAGGEGSFFTHSNVGGSGGSGAWDSRLGEDGGGNLDQDPAYVDADGADGVAGTDDDDVRLAAGSPSIDAGSNPHVVADEADLDDDGDRAEPVPFDLDGQGRFLDDPEQPDTGSGAPPIVDMGSYERLGATTCPPDLDGNGQVDASDLAMLIAAWGPCGACREDLDGDGDVGVRDLLVVLVRWGSCEPGPGPGRRARGSRGVARGREAKAAVRFSSR